MGSIQELRDKTRQKNDEVRKLSAENKKKITDLKAAFEAATDSKKERDEANAKVKELSPRKKKVQDGQKKLVTEIKAKQAELRKFDTQKPRNAEKLKETIDRMEWRLQTEGMPPKAEKELSIEIAKLEKERKAAAKAQPIYDGIRDLRKQMDALNSEFEKIDAELRAAFKAARAAHEKTISQYHKADALKGDISAGFKHLDELARDANASYNEFAKARDESHEQVRARHESMRENAKAHEHAQRNSEREKMERERRKMHEEEDKVFEALKSGKKITLG